jgi:MFS-type transporter involved in bile tolerance (Atg22 family)
MDNNESEKISKLSQSLLAMFAGIFALMETVIVAFISQSVGFDPIDGIMLILMTVCIFALIVLARPQALYPPSEWKEPSPAPDARIALWALIIFIFCIGGGWALSEVVEKFKVCFA